MGFFFGKKSKQVRIESTTLAVKIHLSRYISQLFGENLNFVRSLKFITFSPIEGDVAQ